MKPLALHLASAAATLPELYTWLAVLQPSKGPLATVLPFVLLLALSRVQSAQQMLLAGDAQPQAGADENQMPAQPAMSASLDKNPSGSSRRSGSARSSGTDSRGQPLRPTKRQRLAEPPQTLASKLVSMLAEGLASDVGNVAEPCLLSLSKAALQSVCSEPAALADSGPQASAPSPASAALEIVLDSQAKRQTVLAARLAMCVSPCWNGCTPVLPGQADCSWFSTLQGVAIQREGHPTVRCVLRAHTSSAHWYDVTWSSCLTCTLDGRQLCLQVGLGLETVVQCPGVLVAGHHASLYLRIAPADDGDQEPAHFAAQLYYVEAYAVHRAQLQVLAAGGHAQNRRFPGSWTAGANVGKESVGMRQWVLRDVVQAEFPGDMFVCVDVRLVT